MKLGSLKEKLIQPVDKACFIGPMTFVQADLLIAPYALINEATIPPLFPNRNTACMNARTMICKHQTCDCSKVNHIEEAISGDFANAARVVRICAFSFTGTEHPSKPNKDAMGSQA